MGSPCGEELVLDQTGHARYDGDERRGRGVQRDEDLEHLLRHEHGAVGQTVFAPSVAGMDAQPRLL